MRQQEVDILAVWGALTDATRRLYAAAEKNLQPTGLSLLELRILKSLYNSGSSPMTKLASEQMITKAGLTSTIDRLEEKRLVERDRSGEDRRVINIRITDEGKEELKKALQIHRRFVERSLGSLTEEEITALLTILRRLAP